MLTATNLKGSSVYVLRHCFEAALDSMTVHACCRGSLQAVPISQSHAYALCWSCLTATWLLAALCPTLLDKRSHKCGNTHMGSSLADSHAVTRKAEHVSLLNIDCHTFLSCTELQQCSGYALNWVAGHLNARCPTVQTATTIKCMPETFLGS